ncbi:DNA adenine methylase [Brucella sp. 2716]|uniref:DNA adenine methylase n=1 Tax=Brucella sp. 2716 TaxID=2975052 RepID=UPI00217E091A|nr:DNA adenine methylase [Brucella sp. 2716]UWF60987.1 DNA adenine methylase [Brucella sp. 2716]
MTKPTPKLEVKIKLDFPVPVKGEDGKEASRDTVTMRRPRTIHVKRLAVLLGTDVLKGICGSVRPARDTLYIDPPYWGTEDYYGKELFSRDQYEVMAERLGRLAGRFILSINDVPEIRSIFSEFQIDTVSLSYTAGGGKGKPVKEVIISGGA